MKTMTIILSLLICSVSLYSCGNSNVLSSTYQENDKEKAENSIASGDYGTAISLLNNYIVANPVDYSAQSMLANAYMLRAGIDILNIIVNISNNIGTAKNNLYVMIGAFPTGNQSNIADINTAITILNNIPMGVLTSNQILQTAVANAALAFLTANMTIFSAGVIDPVLVASMSTADADTIYNSLVNVQTGLNSLGVVAGTGSGTGRLLDIINQITSTPGATGSDKLKAYFLANA